MNSDSPTPRDELEARVTALLLGQLTAGEEEALRLAMESDTELRRLHDRLRQTIGLVREAVVSPGEVDRPPVEALKLSNERRATLEASFKTIRPKEIARREQRRVQRRELALLAAMILGLLVVAGPMFLVKKRGTQAEGFGAVFLAGRPARLADEHIDSYAFRARIKADQNAPDANLATDLAKKQHLDVVAQIPRHAEPGGVKLYATPRQEQATPLTSSPPPPSDLAASSSSASRSRVAGADVAVADNVGALGGAGGANWDGGGIAVLENRLRFDVDQAVRASDFPAITPHTGLPAGPAEFAKQVSKPGDSAPAGRGGRASMEAEGKAKAAEPSPVTAILAPALQPTTPERADGLAFRSMRTGTAPFYSVSLNPPVAAPAASAEAVGDRQSVLAFGTAPERLGRLNPTTVLPTEPPIQNRDELGQRVESRVSGNQPTPTGRPVNFGNELSLATNAALPVQTETFWAESFQADVPRLRQLNESLASNRTLDRSGVGDQLATAVGQQDQKEVAKTEKESISAGSRDGRFAEAERRQDRSRGQIELRELARVEPATEIAGKGLELRTKSRGEERKAGVVEADVSVARTPPPSALVPQPEVITADNAFSTFSLNVSDVSFKLAAASLENGRMPDPATVRTEEFINAFDYRDPEPTGRQPLAFHWERARYPFAHNRDLVRFSVKTAASGRPAGRPLNLVLLLDNSGSMERADRQRIRLECLRVLAAQLQPSDRVSVVAFARTPRLWIDGLPGSQGAELAGRVGQLTPEGGTNLEEAMNLAYQTARRHFQPGGLNRVVLLTDGAANLGDVEPASLKQQVEDQRRQGVALDCFGLGWDGYNDDLLETLSRNGDGRYGFINTPEAAATEFAGQLAGALRVAASDVKVQIQFNPRRVTAYRQLGYAKHQLTKQQFRDNTVDAAEIGAAEAGNALYLLEVNSSGEGPLGMARVRFKVPGTSDYRELEWSLAYDASAKAFEQAPPALRLAGIASAFSEWLVASPFAADITPSRLLTYLGGVAGAYSIDSRPKQLEAMLRQAGSLSGK